MEKRITVVGAGIGGMAAALACAQTGWRVALLEQSQAVGEIGAGIQLGPNAVRALQALGLQQPLQDVAAYPEALRVRNALSADTLAVMPLGQASVQRYGAAYATVARADLHAMLWQAAQARGSVSLQRGVRVVDVQQDASVAPQVSVSTQDGHRHQTPVLVGADGLWSGVRPYVVADGAPRLTGHLAWRAMVQQSELPSTLRSHSVTAWLGPDFHAVVYPVRRGEWLNMVVIVHGTLAGDPQRWDHLAAPADLRQRLVGACMPLRDLVQAVGTWRQWALYDRVPMASAAEHARGAIALLGDAAHPMRPYLAQGAGMAIEDALALANCLADLRQGVPQALGRYAGQRWQRNARVQARAIRNGRIFHLKGPMRVARDASLRIAGTRLLDMPWLYGGP